MDRKRGFLEDYFNLEEFKSEFGKITEQNFYKKNKFKFGILHFLIMFAAVAIAFLLYFALSACIEWLRLR